MTETEERPHHDETIIAVKPGLGAAKRSSGRPSRTGRRLPWLGISAGVLLAIAAAVFFVLPSWVDERAANAPVEEPAVIEVPEPAGPVLSDEELAALEARAESLLADLLPQQARLEALAAVDWGGQQWVRYEETARGGDDALLGDAFAVAVTAYEEALDIGARLLARSQEIVAATLDSGRQALEAGNAGLAIEQFDLVLGIEPGNEVALNGRARAERLPEVIALVRRGDELRGEQEFDAAADAYRAALAIDERWAPARTALTAVMAEIARARFGALLSGGFAALAEEDFEEAETRFRAALQMRSDSAEARDGLTLAEQGLKLDRIEMAEARALAFERRELWDRAIAQYTEALATDATLEFAIEGLARARARDDLDAKLVNLIENPELLLTDTVLSEAELLVAQARGIADPGPGISEQLARLDQLVVAARTPLPVQLESDELTEVTVYRVGRLGAFKTTQIEVRPGTYTVVGSRRGYRDIRKSFTVLPGREVTPVSVICVEPI
ncbi:hypothetical protein [Candidatus Rariloculus sp.]|uniref:hypothetical protein n=1 Tax=Candidatus Rariloculus sp. TaxID=3101265 RepID=UPI003D0E6FA2